MPRARAVERIEHLLQEKGALKVGDVVALLHPEVPEPAVRAAVWDLIGKGRLRVEPSTELRLA